MDFPAVKFPTIGANSETVKPVASPPTADALSSPQNDQQGKQAVHSNPVFFQVDDPSSIEQPQSAARVVAWRRPPGQQAIKEAK